MCIYLKGYTEVRYDEERKRVVYEPLQLTQAFRSVLIFRPMPSLTTSATCSNFEAQSPWEMVGDGAEPIRPDEFKSAPPQPAEKKEEVKK